ncbi:uncharacterized protein LOC132271707 [Cornus florida]|uniref:uncharacterized protein LOC132271707 n=1 Tax=Cornus florida TaxID=4283 RepID=UPI00289A59FD|nr:uncharacterized protein LOC132271707 [Cornus florida]
MIYLRRDIDEWQQMKHPIGVQGIDAEAPLNIIQFKAKDVAIWLNEKKFIIPKILCFPYMHGDFILGCNFIYSYLPLQLNEKSISLTLKDKTVVEIPIQENLASVCNEKFSPPKRESDALVLQDTHWLYNSLRQNFSENPLTLWKRSPRFCRLQLKNRNVVIRVKPMIYLRRDIDEFDAQLQELLEKKLIERTKSPHSSPAFLVRNHSEVKRGKARMVINYKRLNEHLVFDGYFIPRKDVLLNQTRGSTIFSKFDCKAGFWQIKLRKKSKPLTAFSTPHGHYQWTVMPFGLNTAPQIYQRWMDSIFNDLKDFVVVYIDDILVFSKTREEHNKHLICLSEKLKKYGIILSPTKIDVEQESIDFLGLVLTHKGIKLQDHIIIKIRDFPDILQDKKQLQSFLGILNYGRSFIKGLAQKELPLLKKLQKNAPFDWTDNDTTIIKQIKADLVQIPEVYFPQNGDKLILETDASELCWGCVLKAIPQEKWIDDTPSSPMIRARKAPISKKDCKCYICNEAGHYATNCPQKGKKASKMVKRLQTDNLCVAYGSDITDPSTILYELSSSMYSSDTSSTSQHSTDDDSDIESICMMNVTPSNPEENTNIKLSDIIGEEVQFTNEQLIEFDKLQRIKKEEVYKR